MKPTFAANGGVFAGPGISAHSGTIVSSPTVFPFAKGVGLMGEAGPEAILPLKRNAQGKLGIAAENAGHSNNNLYNITVNVEAKQGESASQFGDRAAQAIIRSIAKEEISNARRPGNTLNKSRFA
jgi:phage-related minor tail protein